MYFIRFAPKVPLSRRKHQMTLGRFDSYTDAATECEKRDPSGKLLVVEGPR